MIHNTQEILKKIAHEYFKGIALGLDPDDEMDDLLDALEKTVDSNADTLKLLRNVETALKDMILILTAIREYLENPDTRMVRNLDIESRKVLKWLPKHRNVLENMKLLLQ